MKQIYIPNKKEDALGSICFIKVDAKNPCLTLGGAVFSLYILNEEKCCYEEYLSNLITQDDGVIIINQLKPSKYMLVENRAPDGYICGNTKICFNIEMDDTGKIIEMGTVLIFNYPKRKRRKCCSCCCCKKCNSDFL